MHTLIFSFINTNIQINPCNIILFILFHVPIFACYVEITFEYWIFAYFKLLFIIVFICLFRYHFVIALNPSSNNNFRANGFSCPWLYCYIISFLHDCPKLILDMRWHGCSSTFQRIYYFEHFSFYINGTQCIVERF
jgi:hypothetical protein